MLHHGLRASLAAAAGVLTSIANQGSSQSTGSTVSWGSPQAGDVAVLFDFARDAGTGAPPAKVVPAGFTEIDSTSTATSNGYRSTISYKICDGSESGSITGQNGGVNRKILTVYRGDVPISSVSVSTVNSFAADADPPAQTISASGGVAPLVCLGSYVQYTFVTGQSMSPSADHTTVNTTYQTVRDKIYNTAPADVTVDQGRVTSALNLLQSFYLEFA